MTSHEGRPAALGVKPRHCHVRPRQACSQEAIPLCHIAGLARLGPRTERLTANAHCQHNTCALRDTSLASLLWRFDPLWRQCIRSIQMPYLVKLVRNNVYKKKFRYYYFGASKFFFWASKNLKVMIGQVRKKVSVEPCVRFLKSFSIHPICIFMIGEASPLN